MEQDAAYWEGHVGATSKSLDVWWGVATRKDMRFYKGLEDQHEGKFNRDICGMSVSYSLDYSSPELLQTVTDHSLHGTEWMKKITVKEGDIVGVAVQQSDLPMIQFLLNGEPLHDLSIHRFRGSVYPSVYLPEDVSIKLVFDESEFEQMSPSSRFGPLIVARGLI
jgi:hypothetical protein